MSTPQENDEAAKAAKLAKWLRIGAIVVGVGLLVGFALAIFLEVKSSEKHEVWSQFTALEDQYEGDQDYLYHDRWVGTDAIYSAPRVRFVQTLHAFLDKKAGEMDATLEPQVRWRLAKTLTDHLLSSPDVLEYAKRAPQYDDAISQLEKIRDAFPDYPLNWSRLQTGEQPTLTRTFLEFLQANQAWEREHLPTAKDPDGKHTVVFRTNRGDVRMKMYETDAPEWTAAFLKRAISGAYDGTAIFQKKDLGTAKEPEQHYVRAGADAFRDAEAYDREGHVEMQTELSETRGLVPASSRSKVLHVRGVVSAWHERGSSYDDPREMIFVQRRSPLLDYDYTPVGKVMDEASLATLDRIYEGNTWDDDTDTRDDLDARFGEILDFFQVPAEITKVLVFDAQGQLLEPTGDDAAEGRAAPSDGEKRLGGLKTDAYKSDVPQRAATGADEEADDGEGAADEDADAPDEEDEDQDDAE